MWYVDEINIYVLALCSFSPEVIIHSSLESFNGVMKVLNYMHKTCVEYWFGSASKYEDIFCNLKFHKMFSNLLWALIYFTRRATCVEPFKKNLHVCIECKDQIIPECP
jgi:hypothetical protein